jgi:hypothetical protein
MTNDTIIMELKTKNILTSNGINAAYTRREWFKSSEVLIHIKNNTSFLPECSKLAKRVYCITNNLQDEPQCICGKKLKFASLALGYSRFCSTNCSRKVVDWKSSKNTKKTNIANVLSGFLELLKESEDQCSLIEVKDFIKKRLDDTNWGRNHLYCSTKQYKENATILASIIFKTKNLLRIDIDQIKKFHELKMGERFYILHTDIKQLPMCEVCGAPKSFISNVDGYAVTCSKKCQLDRYKLQSFKSIEEQGFSILNKDNITNIGSERYEILCSSCGKSHSREMFNGRWKQVYCPGCYGDIGISKEETEVKTYIESLINRSLIQSHTIPIAKKEIDIFDEQTSFGIEYNGAYWHSTDKFEDVTVFKYKHRNKTQECWKQNIKLFHIFSFEWKHVFKRRIWESMIKNHFKLNKSIYARKCEIRNVSTFDCNVFLANNHLQGEDRASIRYGLYFEDKLISIMTFCKSRFDKNYEWELSRFCSLINHNVVGGASKLFNHFLQSIKPNSIITYANMRYSTGKLYETLNFEKSHLSIPNYFFLDSKLIENTPLSRIQTQKHKLPKLLKEKFNHKHTEIENMLNSGYRIIYDCGNLVYTYHRR